LAGVAGTVAVLNTQEFRPQPPIEIPGTPEAPPHTNTKLATDYIRLSTGARYVYRNKTNGVSYWVRVDSWGDGSATSQLEIANPTRP
jgi:hypothetical protein